MKPCFSKICIFQPGADWNPKQLHSLRFQRAGLSSTGKCSDLSGWLHLEVSTCEMVLGGGPQLEPRREEKFTSATWRYNELQLNTSFNHRLTLHFRDFCMVYLHVELAGVFWRNNHFPIGTLRSNEVLHRMRSSTCGWIGCGIPKAPHRSWWCQGPQHSLRESWKHGLSIAVPNKDIIPIWRHRVSGYQCTRATWALGDSCLRWWILGFKLAFEYFMIFLL